jgi:hypothetical protein
LEIERQKKKILSERKEFMKELAIMKETVKMCGTTQDRNMILKYQQNLKVQLFNELEGIPPQVVDLLNEKLRLSKEEAEVQLANKDHEIYLHLKKIAKFEQVSPDT